MDFLDAALMGSVSAYRPRQRPQCSCCRRLGLPLTEKPQDPAGEIESQNPSCLEIELLWLIQVEFPRVLQC